MKTRRKTVRGRGGKRLVFRHRRPVVRATYDVIPIYNTYANGCQAFIAQSCNVGSATDPPFDCDDTPGENGDVAQCCNTVTEVKLVTNEYLQDKYNDKLKIVRLIGHVKAQLTPVLQNQDPLTCHSVGDATSFQRDFIENYSQMVTVGIHKYRLAQTGANTPVGSPETDTSSPFLSYPWTEGRWLWQRHAFWAPPTRVGMGLVNEGSQLGCWPNVSASSAGAPENTLSSGSGTVNIPAISTSVNRCLADAVEVACAGQWPYFETSYPPWQTFRIHVRKPIILGADEALHLQLGWAHPRTLLAQLTNHGGWGCSRVRRDVYGSETSYLSWHMKIKAVVQHNY